MKTFPEFTINLGQPSQIADLMQIEQLALQSFQDLEVRTWFMQHPTPPEVLEKAIDDSCLWVAELSTGEVAGFGDVTSFESDPYLAGLYVHPQFSQQGIGTALLSAIVKEMQVRGFGQIWLTTTSNHHWHQPFYERQGFHVVNDETIPLHIQMMLQIEARMGWRTRRVAMRRML